MHPLLRLRERDPTFGTRYPWQHLTERFGVQLAHRLPLLLDVARLEADLKSLQQRYPMRPHHGVYHDGGWRGINLVAPGGALAEDRPLPGARFEKTEALQHAPYLDEVIDLVPGHKQRTRVLALGPGEHIFWHYDFGPALARRNLRLHVPITTNPHVRFQLSHEDLTFNPGETWLCDFSFPHRVYNGGEELRVHLVMDVILDDETLPDGAMFPARYFDEAAARDRVRHTIRTRYGWWFRLDPRVVLRRLKTRWDGRSR